MAQKYFFCEKYNYLPQSGLMSLFSKRHNYKAKSCRFVLFSAMGHAKTKP